MNDRGGCLNAWLVLVVIVLGVGSALYFLVGAVKGGQGNGEASTLSILLSIALSIGAAGAASLLTKRRLGFYLIVISIGAAGLLQVLATGRLEIAVAGLLILAFTWWLVRPVWSKLP
jgi:hypothetical protein